MTTSSPLRVDPRSPFPSRNSRPPLALALMGGGVLVAIVLGIMQLSHGSGRPSAAPPPTAVAPPVLQTASPTASPTATPSPTPAVVAPSATPIGPQTTVDDCIWYPLPEGGTWQTCKHTN